MANANANASLASATSMDLDHSQAQQQQQHAQQQQHLQQQHMQQQHLQQQHTQQQQHLGAAIAAAEGSAFMYAYGNPGAMGVSNPLGSMMGASAPMQLPNGGGMQQAYVPDEAAWAGVWQQQQQQQQ